MTGYDVIVLGAGASGLLCAMEAGRRGRKVLCLGHGDQAGRKVLVSGGGHCNFTNLRMGPEHYRSRNRHYCKSALARYGAQDFIAFLARHGLGYHEKKSGQLFCDRSAGELLNTLLNRCREAAVVIRPGCRIQRITGEGPFRVETSQGNFESLSLVVATGGLAYPQLGASDLGYRIARQYGLKVVPPRPALVPFLFGRSDGKRFQGLAGISLEGNVRCSRNRVREGVLFTHKGLSGPAILQISSHWQRGDPLTIDLAPDRDLFAEVREEKQRRPNVHLRTVLSNGLPKRLIECFTESRIENRPLQQVRDTELKAVANLFHLWTVLPEATEGYSTAEVTAGGVDTGELSSKTMAAKKIKGLYFIGEVVDVTGDLGGYNLQWAWSSGYCAGQFV